MAIKIKRFVCPICKRGECFILYDFDNIRCDSCKNIIPNPIFKEDRAFTIEFIEDIIIVDNLEIIED